MPWRSYEVFVMKKLELIMRHRCGSGQRPRVKNNPWWRHQMKTFFALLALCAGNSPVTGEFSAQRPVVTRSFDVFFDLRLNKRLSKQWWCWWFETQSRPSWRQCNDLSVVDRHCAGDTRGCSSKHTIHLHTKFHLFLTGYHVHGGRPISGRTYFRHICSLGVNFMQ